MRHPRSLLLIMFSAIAMMACASRGENTLDTPPADVRVTVTNDAFWDANIYLLHGATRRRLGTVNGHSKQTFVVPRSAMAGLTEVRFAIDWIGRRESATSESVVADPGDVIELVIR